MSLSLFVNTACTNLVSLWCLYKQVGITVKNNPGSNSDIVPLRLFSDCFQPAFRRLAVDNKLCIEHKIGLNYEQKTYSPNVSDMFPELANCCCDSH